MVAIEIIFEKLRTLTPCKRELAMTDILCKWLNEDVFQEPKLTKSSFPGVFSNGYLFGEVLHKYGLQPDFAHFSNAKSSEAKLNNFTRLEPTFKLLEIPFNTNTARNVMTEKPGVATKLLYQLFVALNRVRESKVTGQSLETTKSTGRVKLEKIESKMFEKRLKQQTPRQVDLNFEDLIHKFQERHKSFEERMLNERRKEEEMMQQERREFILKSLDKSHEVRERQAQLYARLKPLSPTKPPPTRTKTTGSLPRTSRRQTAEALTTKEEIDQFEAGLSLRSAPVGEQRPHTTGSTQEPISYVKTGPSSDYVAQIRKRVQDNELVRKEREKRRRKVLVEQMEALQEQENTRRERMLVERLMRQCQQERRIATQLMAIRKEKDTIRNNRIYRQAQYEEQRVREFTEALDRERELARCEAKDREEKLKHHKTVYRQLRADKAEQRYHRSYQMCQDMVSLIVDITCKLAEYRELTNKLVPAKLMIDWKTLFVAGKSVYDDPNVTSDPVDPMTQSMTSGASSNLMKSHRQLLDQADLIEYKTATAGWIPPQELSSSLPCPHNSILSHIVYRLLDTVDPPQPHPKPPSYPDFILRATVMGRPFAGKSTILRRLEQDFPLLRVLNPEDLVTKAMTTFLSEKRLLESQLSTSPTEGEVPVISVEPSTPLGPREEAANNVKGPNEEAPNNEIGISLGSESAFSEQLASKLTELGRLGRRAHNAVTSGEALDDETLVDVLTAELRSLPDGSGFIIDNFPLTHSQMITLLTSVYGSVGPITTLSREFQLLPKGDDNSRDLDPVSDLVIHLHISTDNVLLRASETEAKFPGNKLEQVHHRLLTFDTEWPPLKRWILKYGQIININANDDPDSVYELVKQKFQEAINKARHSIAVRELGISQEDSALSCGSATNLEASPSSTHQVTSNSSVQSRGRSRRPSSAGQLKAAAQLIQEAVSSNDPLANKLSMCPAVVPGDPEWVYCDCPLNMELASGLAQVWPTLEEVYINTLKDVFAELREDREAVCHYFHDKRTEFQCYLSRPDTKQEFVSQWQIAYNDLPPHLRREALMKAELHQRVDDLSEKLWDICDHRRESAGQERGRILSDGWVDDHTGLITNHYITLMQAELDRFYSTAMLLKDYYTGMEDKVPAKLPDPGRLSLVELTPTPAQDVPSSVTSSTQSMKETVKEETEEPTPEQTPKKVRSKSKVPLLPRQLLPEPTEEKVPKKKGGGSGHVTPPPPMEDISGLDLDEQLVVHAFNTANTFVFTTVIHDVRVLDSAIAELSKAPPTAPPPEPPPPEPKEEKSGKGKKDKAKSPSGKKGRASPGKSNKTAPPPEPVAETTGLKLSPSDLVKRQQTLFMHQEHKAALQQEESRVKLRLELIKLKCLEVIAGIKETAVLLGEEMQQWLEAVFSQEVHCVDNLAELLRQAIENEQKLLQEILLPGPSLTIKESCLLSHPTPPPSPPPPTEPSLPHTFTVSQLHSLHTQLLSLAPDGFILSSALIETLVALVDSGGSSLPDQWTTLSSEQFETLVDGVFGVGADLVDWRRFLVTIAQPWTMPTIEELVAMVTAESGHVSREEFSSLVTWLDNTGVDHDVRLKQAFFELLSDGSDSVDLIDLLLYLCADPSPSQGLLKALAVLTASDPTYTNVTLEQLHKVLKHGSHPTTPPVSTGDLFDLFVMLSPAQPNEVAVQELMVRENVWKYLTSVSPYNLTVLEPYIRPISRQTETDSVNA